MNLFMELLSIVLQNQMTIRYDDKENESNMYKVVAELLKDMESKGIPPNTIIYNSLMNGASRSGDSSKVKQIFSNMINSGIKPDAVSYNILIKEAVKVPL